MLVFEVSDLTMLLVTILCGWCHFFLGDGFSQVVVAPSWGQEGLPKKGWSPPTKDNHHPQRVVNNFKNYVILCFSILNYRVSKKKITSQRLLYISIVKNTTKLTFIMLERRIPPAHFEYKMVVRRYLFTEICKAELTEPRHGKDIFRKFSANILLYKGWGQKKNVI